MIRNKIFLALIFCLLLLPSLAWGMLPDIQAGTVISKELAGKYTILEIQQEDKKFWVAASGFDAEVGDEIEYMGGVAMVDFYVKSLERTFDEILFLTNIRHVISEEEAAALAAAEKEAAEKAQQGITMAMPADENHQKFLSEGSVVAPKAGEILKAEAELTVAELFAQREALVDKIVSVRGRVLKLSKNILGRNWATLSDGTGTAPNNVLRITTQQEVIIGETVSATGMVKIDIDLGAPGYQYPVILEEAMLTP